MRPPRHEPLISFLNTWTAEKAWWWGALLGDGNVYADFDRCAYKVSIVGSYSTVRRWLDLISPFSEPQEIKREVRTRPTFQGQVYSKPLIEWFRDNAFTGPKCSTLQWPDDLPDEFMVPFLRGLWDTDGSLSIFKRPNKDWRPEFKASFGVKTRPFVERVYEELKKRLVLPDIVIIDTSGVTAFAFSSASAKIVADYLYKDCPKHIRNEDRYDVYLKMCETQEHYDNLRCTCGEKLEREGQCLTCWWKTTYVSKVDRTITCPCGKPIHAKGLCTTCHSRRVRAEASGITLQEALEKICKTTDCGNRAAFGKDECRNCSLRTWTDRCVCGKAVRALGMCKACYERQRRAETAKQIAKEDGVPYIHRPAGRPDLEQFHDEIIKAYKAGTSSAELAKTYRTSGPTIIDRLRKAGVHIRKRWEAVVPETPPTEPSE